MTRVRAYLVVPRKTFWDILSQKGAFRGYLYRGLLQDWVIDCHPAARGAHRDTGGLKTEGGPLLRRKKPPALKRGFLPAEATRG